MCRVEVQSTCQAARGWCRVTVFLLKCSRLTIVEPDVVEWGSAAGQIDVGLLKDDPEKLRWLEHDCGTLDGEYALEQQCGESVSSHRER